MQEYEMILVSKTERVCIFKIPPLSTSKGYYLDDWKEMIWEGGVKMVEKNKIIHITFIAKDGKVFASTKLPPNPKQAIVKTVDSTRGYALKLQKPNGGFFWVGVVFRDRNDAFDFGVALNDYVEKKSLNEAKLKQQFSNQVDFSVKKGQKIKINIGDNDKKKKQSTNNDFNLFNFPPPTQNKPVNSNNQDFFNFDFPQNKPTKPTTTNNQDFFSFDFPASNQPKNPNQTDKNANNKKKNEVNLLDL